ncbi:MAG TPA: GFA family protein [Candidatus Binataceae bacterium]|nr:GFA family protein [Candidatus Binataceae bacterium]
MKVDGRCHCGQITYEAEVDPDTVGICHCTDCQVLAGSAYRVIVRAPAESFILRTGQPKIYIKTADSGAKRAHAFCPDCGTPIYAAAIKDPPTYSLRIGGIRQRAELRPKRQIWCSSALPWAMDLRGVEQSSRQ